MPVSLSLLALMQNLVPVSLSLRALIFSGEHKMPSKYKQQSKKSLMSLSMVFGLSALSLTLMTPTLSHAEALQMPAVPKSYSVTLPGRGMSMTEVLEKFGEPETKQPEVGEPPITRWVYSNYVVIFEYQYVIHSLTTNKPMGIMPPKETATATAEKMQPEAEKATEAKPVSEDDKAQPQPPAAATTPHSH